MVAATAIGRKAGDANANAVERTAPPELAGEGTDPKAGERPTDERPIPAAGTTTGCSV